MWHVQRSGEPSVCSATMSVARKVFLIKLHECRIQSRRACLTCTVRRGYNTIKNQAFSNHSLFINVKVFVLPQSYKVTSFTLCLSQYIHQRFLSFFFQAACIHQTILKEMKRFVCLLFWCTGDDMFLETHILSELASGLRVHTVHPPTQRRGAGDQRAFERQDSTETCPQLNA